MQNFISNNRMSSTLSFLLELSISSSKLLEYPAFPWKLILEHVYNLNFFGVIFKCKLGGRGRWWFIFRCLLYSAQEYETIEDSSVYGIWCTSRHLRDEAAIVCSNRIISNHPPGKQKYPRKQPVLSIASMRERFSK